VNTLVGMPVAVDASRFPFAAAVLSGNEVAGRNADEAIAACAGGYLEAFMLRFELLGCARTIAGELYRRPWPVFAKPDNRPEWQRVGSRFD